MLTIKDITELFNKYGSFVYGHKYLYINNIRKGPNKVWAPIN